jgi:NAD(P)-dependent dehydrogenase (short-subunit alcohol dehydrogenase family)
MHDVGAGTNGVAPIRCAFSAASTRCGRVGYRAGRQHPIDHRAGCHALVQDPAPAWPHHFLIHNAGWVEYQALEAIEDDALERMLCLAAKTPVVGTGGVAGNARGGRWPHRHHRPIARCIRSTRSAVCPPMRWASWALGLVNVLALEGAEHGIVVNAVSPVAKTRMWGIDGEPTNCIRRRRAGRGLLASTRCQDGGGHCVQAMASSMLRLQEAEHCVLSAGSARGQRRQHRVGGPAVAGHRPRERGRAQLRAYPRQVPLPASR